MSAGWRVVEVALFMLAVVVFVAAVVLVWCEVVRLRERLRVRCSDLARVTQERDAARRRTERDDR